MSVSNKGKAKNNLAWLCLLPFIILTYCFAGANHLPANFFYHSFIDTIPFSKTVSTVSSGADSIPIPTEKKRKSSLIPSGKPVADTSIIPIVDTFSFKTSKDSLDVPVAYHADDSMILDVPNKKILLYGKSSSIKYSDNDLSAPFIEYDQKTNLVKAFLVKDSTGKVISYPAFKQGDFKSVIDTIQFNMKSGKGLTKGTYTQQGEIFVYGEKIKKIDQDVFYALRARFTTCNLDTPHFAFISKKIKFINKKMAFTGPVHPEFEGVPLPVYLPFGIFPLTQGRHSGLLAPTFTANEQLGLALEGLGYYKIISPNWDVETRGTLYSYGGWAAKVSPRYFRRYHYQGNFSLDVQKYKPLDQASNKSLLITWNHNADTKARPGVTFNAHVDAGSSKFNSQVANNPVLNFKNTLTSSITYSKVWKDKPYNISVSANHNQNTNLRLININFPDVSFNVNTLYPFRRKEPVGDYKWYENLGIALNTTARSLTYFYDTAGNAFGQLKNNLQWGANHNVPISLSLPQLGPFQVAPFVSYTERWYQQRRIYRWNPGTKRLDTTINKGFYAARDMSFGVGISTRIFGLYSFNKNSKVQAIRHEIRPSFSLSYKPNFNGNNSFITQVDTAGTLFPFSVYDGSIYGGFSTNKSGGVSINIDNNLSMKVRNKKDTGEAAIKKVSLIDGLSFNTFYDLLADSFKLSPINVSAHTNLFNKFNITAGASFDPYQANRENKRIDKLVWSKKPLSLGTLTSAQVSLQSNFKGGDKSKTPNTDNIGPQNIDPRTGLPLDEYQQEAAYIRNNPGEFVDFSIPWSVDISYSLRYNKFRNFGGQGYTKSFNQDANFNSSVNLTAKWKIGVTGSYNITTGELGYVSMFLSRDMHCWQMAINIAPVGRFRFFSINISPKSPILRDLKINRTRSFIDQ
ncbi:MAG: putative LPS assembly protein LptD [Ferruginibacter sp.]